MNTHKVYGFFLLLVVWAAAASAQEIDQGYEKAVTAHQAGEYKEAYIHLKNVLQSDPDNIQARLLLAQVHFNEGDIYSAEKESDQALLLGADINLVLPVYGVSLVLQGKVDKLFEIEQVSGSFTTASRFEWALLKGQGYLLKNEPELASAEFEKAAAMFPEDTRANNTLASVYLAEKMFDDATRLIDKSLALDPKNPKTWQLRGELALEQSDYNLALRYFSKAHELSSEDLRNLRSMAHVNMLLGNNVEMQKYLDLILEQSPGDPAATLLSAILIMNKGDAKLGTDMLASLSDKLSLLEKARIQSGDNFLFIRASADYVRGNDESAINLLNSYLSRNRDDIAAIRMLVDLYLRNGDNNQAALLLSNSKSAIATDFGLTLQLLQLYIDNGNIFGARELLGDIKKVNDDNPYVIMLEAEFQRSLGQPENGLAILDGRDYGAREPLDYGLLRAALQLDMHMELQAQDTALRLRKRFPENVRVQNLSAITCLRAGKLAEAERHIQQALQLDSTNVQARFNQAMLLRTTDKLEQASTLLNSILRDRPGHTQSILLMAQILFVQGKTEEAIDWSRKVYVYEDSASAPGELQLDIYSQLGNWDKALPVALKLSKQNPLNTDYLVRLAQVYMQLNDYESAQRPLHKLYTLWEESPTALRELAALQTRSHNLAAARKSLEKAREWDLQSFEVRLELARLSLMEGNPAFAAEVAAILQSEFGDRSELAYFQGEVELERQDMMGAQARFSKAYALDESNTEALIQLYKLSIQGVGAAQFTSMLEERLKESTLPGWTIRLLADSHLAQGNRRSAAFYYEGLLQLPGLEKDQAILNNLANIYADDDLDKALATAMDGLSEGGKKNASLLDTIGWIMVRQGRSEKALPYFREAYTVNSTDPEIRYHTGVALIELERTREAEIELRAALDNEKDFTGSEQAAKLVRDLETR